RRRLRQHVGRVRREDAAVGAGLDVDIVVADGDVRHAAQARRPVEEGGVDLRPEEADDGVGPLVELLLELHAEALQLPLDLRVDAVRKVVRAVDAEAHRQTLLASFLRISTPRSRTRSGTAYDIRKCVDFREQALPGTIRRPRSIARLTKSESRIRP